MLLAWRGHQLHPSTFSLKRFKSTGYGYTLLTGPSQLNTAGNVKLRQQLGDLMHENETLQYHKLNKSRLSGRNKTPVQKLQEDLWNSCHGFRQPLQLNNTASDARPPGKWCWERVVEGIEGDISLRILFRGFGLISLGVFAELRFGFVLESPYLSPAPTKSCFLVAGAPEPHPVIS